MPGAAAQAPAACTTRDCIAINNAWVAAAGTHQIKTQLVDVVRQFAAAMAGTYGDEGTGITAGITAMRAVLAQWDEAIGNLESSLKTAVETVDSHLVLGSVYLDRSRFDDALREFATAARLDPRRLDVHTSSALAYDAVGKHAEAAAALRQALAIDGGNPILSYTLSQQLLKLGERDRAQEALQRYQRAQLDLWQRQVPVSPAPFERVSFLRQAAGVAPIFPPAAYAAGFRLLSSGRYEQAFAELQSAAARDPLVAEARPEVLLAAASLRQGRLPAALALLAPLAALDDSEAHRLLGVAYWSNEQFEHSIEQLKEASRLSPADDRARLTLAEVYSGSGRPADAQRVLDELVRIVPTSGQAHFKLAQIYQQQTRHAEAIAALRQAAALEPLAGQDRLYEMLGGLLSNQADFDATAAAYVKRIEVNPNNADGHRKLAEVYFLQGRNVEALAEFTAARMLDPKSANAPAGMGQAYVRLGQWSEAAASLRESLSLNPGNRQARYALATALARLGRAEEGAKELAEMQRLEQETAAAAQRKTDLDATVLEAERASANGDHPSAIALLRKALTYEPTKQALHIALGVSLLRTAQYAQAVDALQQALALGDTPEIHQHLAEAYKSLGRANESQTEIAIYERLTQAAKEDRLRRLSGNR